MKIFSKDLILLIIGSFIFAIGINYFAIPNKLSEGGIIGITIVTYYLFGWSPGITNFVLNTSLVAIGYKYFTKRMTLLTIISIIFTSVFLHITTGWGDQLNGDTLLAALFAGLAVGMGIGLIFKAGGTSGGTTILARLLNQWLGWSVGSAMLIIDIAVIVGSSFVIGKEKAMYTLIAVYVGAKVIDAIVEGTEERSAVMIISDKNEEILQVVMDKMSRGVTVLEARGGYSQADKNVLYIVINKREIVQLKKLVEDIDPDTYITLHRVQEIFRRGYKG
ncbi:YitT family protein [Thalassobacillus devorans]|uniref:YitT family protein n=1 Tax=Thalassobacillus devorans TaxID=279813 RepID=UPI0015947953|nr:YitT family protein [Thalassobacillus devorans]